MNHALAFDEYGVHETRAMGNVPRAVSRTTSNNEAGGAGVGGRTNKDGERDIIVDPQGQLVGG